MNRSRRHLTLSVLAAGAALLLGCWGGAGPGTILVTAGPGGGAQTLAVAVADLNGDGRPDLVSSASAGGWSYPYGYVSVALQSAATAGTFLAPVRSAAGTNPSVFAVVKFQGSALPGLVVANPPVAASASASNTVSVLLPNPAVPGGFLAPEALALGTRNPTAVAASDPAASGTPFLAVAADGGSDVLVFFQGASAGTFGAATSVPAGGQPTAVAVADLDGDGYPDLVVTTAGNTVSVVLQNAAQPGAFLPPISYAVGPGPVAVAVADLNGDGKPDLVVANGGTPTAPTTQGLTVLLQDPARAGAFLAGVTYAVGDYDTCAVAVGDLNGDGRPDLAVANQGLPGQPGSVSVLLQDPAHPGAFLAAVPYPGVYGPTGVAIGDLNGDGLPDLAIADGTPFVRFQVGGSPGTFGAPVPFPR